MDSLPHFDEDDFQAALLAYDGALWPVMEQSALYQHLTYLPYNSATGYDMSELWFHWWLKNNEALSCKLPQAVEPGRLGTLLSGCYRSTWEMFELSEYEFLFEAWRKVPEGLLLSALWHQRPSADLLRTAGDYAAQVAVLMYKGMKFEEASVWARGAGQFHPENPHRYTKKYQGLVAMGLDPAQALGLLLEDRSRPAWQIKALAEGIPKEYVDAL